MVSVGLEGLPLRTPKSHYLTVDCLMAGVDNSDHQGGRKRSMGRKAMEKRAGFGGNYSSENLSGGVPDETAQKFSRHPKDSKPQTSFVRKQVDPETTKYFSEIANVIEGTEIDYEERSAICGNALEETRGKEIELATDYIISHTLQTLLEGCSADHLCSFLRSCSKDFPHIAVDKSGSHVAESALKSLAMHLQDNETHSLIEDTLTSICQAIVVNPVVVMCNCYGSHVLRSLLCLCKGVPINSSEFHAKKSSVVLAERLNFRPSHFDRNYSQHSQPGFPNLLKFLVTEMLKAARKDIATLQVDQYGSLVLQTALKLLVGNEQELLHIIPILLGCSMEYFEEGKLIETNAVQKLLSLMKESAYSHLMEVILEVAPETLYNELLTKVFKNSLSNMSSHHCGNFVVQSLISHARCQNHFSDMLYQSAFRGRLSSVSVHINLFLMELIWEELGTKFKDLFGMGRSGVVASLIATGQRLHSHETKCCQALAAAVCLANESSRYIVPRILFLDNYFFCGDKSNWSWPNDVKMHVMGTLILQSVFRLPSEFIQAYISSITSLEAEHVLQAAKDSGGARVIEGFLDSNASGKQKRKLVVKLRGHFGELSVHPSGSFTVEKCFNVSNMSLREAIVSELLAVQPELCKTKQGPHLLRKLDVDGYAKRPERWKSRQVTKQSTYKDFYDTFGPKETTSSKNDAFLANNYRSSQPEKLKVMRKEIDSCLASAHDTPLGSQFLAHKDSKSKLKISGKRPPEVDTKHYMDDKFLKSKDKGQKHRKDKGDTKNIEASKTLEVQIEKPANSVDKKGKKRNKEDGLSKSSRKKMKT